MEKLIYLLWEEGDPLGVCRGLLETVAPQLLALTPRQLSMNLNDAEADVSTGVPLPEGDSPLTAEISIWLDCLDGREPFEQAIRGTGCRIAGYLVTESLYTDYGGNQHSAPRDWADGTRSPGILTVSLLEKPDRLSYAQWIDHWHNTQSPVSEEIQPRMRYVRNAVVRAVTPDAPPFLGIVDEAWPSVEHLTDPMLFYLAEGSPERMKQNIGRMVESVTGFLDIPRIRNCAMSEYLLKTR